MPVQVSSRILYRVIAVALLPVAGYNLAVGIGAAANNVSSNDYMQALTGGITLLVISIVLTVLSITRQDRLIVLCK
jgi:chromate transport protein ChrA